MILIFKKQGLKKMKKTLFIFVLLILCSQALFSSTQLIVTAPGEIFTPGSGKSGSPLQQTAGSPFYVTVYACDDSWNIDTLEAASVTMTSSDTSAALAPTQVIFTLGRAYVRIELRNAGVQTITASRSGLSPGTTTIPLIFGALDHFNLSQNITSKIAGQSFTVSGTAVDFYDNTVTSFASLPITNFYAGAVLNNLNYYFKTGSAFTNGVGTVSAKIYQRVTNAHLTLTYSSAGGSTNTFDVANSGFSKFIFVAPGQVYDPGNHFNGGVMNNPEQAIAGIPISISIYATDMFGNNITSINDAVSVTASDSTALINGSWAPGSVILSGGQAVLNVAFTKSGTNYLTGSDITNTVINHAVVSIVTKASGLVSFDITGVPLSTAAGQLFSPVVVAKDQYNNIQNDYTGTVYLSSNTDYIMPDESTMSVAGQNAGLVGSKWAVTFTALDAGTNTLTGYFYRAATFTAQIFASDNYYDTPGAYAGHIGKSGLCDVSSSSVAKMQLLAPGMQARPGTADGENNTPTAQYAGSFVTCTVNITDNWWNVVPGRSDQAGITTNDPTNTRINGSDTLPVEIFLSNGTATFTERYYLPTSASMLLATDLSVGGIAQDWSPYMTFNEFDHSETPVVDMSQISITGPGGAAITDKTAAVPFDVVITVYSSPGVVDTGFNGAIDLFASTDYSYMDSTISVQRSINFTSGVANMQLTLYRAQDSMIIYGQYGQMVGTSNIFNVLPGPVSRVLVLADGMQLKPGLAHDGIFGYQGYDGYPKTVEAGIGSRLEVLLVDSDYNKCPDTPISYCKISSSDPFASLDGISLASGNVYVTVTAGSFVSASGMVLNKTGTTGIQHIQASYNYNTNTSPNINVRHSTFSKLVVSAPSGPVTAGTSFLITLTATDIYGNVCDYMNGGAPFYSLINLTASTGPNTMWPLTYSLNNGTANAEVTLYKAPSMNISITADDAGVYGTSGDIITVPGVFKRLLVLGQSMARQNGIFTLMPPSGFMMYDASRPIYWSSPIYVNDGGHNPGGELFTIFSCDLYGNITATADASGQTINIVVNDQFASPVTPPVISAITGQAQFNLILHTAKTGVSVTASMDKPGIENFTTPPFKTIAGDSYGLQIILPGYQSQGGSGYYDTVSSKWFNGVTGTPQVKLSGEPFCVTVRAVDIYGNMTNDSPDKISVSSGAQAPSFPSTTSDFEGTLGDADLGLLTLTAHFNVISPQYVSMYAQDMWNIYLNREWLSYPYVYVSDIGAPTATQTFTYTQTSTITLTTTATQTATGTFTPTQTCTLQPSQTQTASGTATSVLANTFTVTMTATAVQTPAVTPPAVSGNTTYSYPQPAFNTVNFVFAIEKAADVTIEIYNVVGTMVAKTTGFSQPSQAATLALNTSSFAPGVYYYLISAKSGGNREIKFKANKFLVAK